jgi:hypothetical protein
VVVVVTAKCSKVYSIVFGLKHPFFSLSCVFTKTTPSDGVHAPHACSRRESAAADVFFSSRSSQEDDERCEHESTFFIFERKRRKK